MRWLPARLGDDAGDSTPFGPSKLPEIRRTFGRMLSEFKDSRKESAEGTHQKIRKARDP
ncbi:hypothetical protein ERY13_10345 [Paenibacillus mucilaginosus]|nr:hypothetical protein ERY13_10345 [Paenibacillus mucilaginosus]